MTDRMLPAAPGPHDFDPYWEGEAGFGVAGPALVPGSAPPASWSPPAPELAQGAGFGAASLVLGILSLVLFDIPAFGLLSGTLAVIFGIVALTKKNRGVAIGGVATGGLSLLFCLLLSAVLIFHLGSH